MKLLSEAFGAAANAAPDHIAVVDPLGRHTRAAVMQAASELAGQLAEAVDAPPTVLVQADHTWRHLATALAVGLRGGVIAVISHHAALAEFALALEDIDPDVVLAAPETLRDWGGPAPAFADRRPALDGFELAVAPRQARGVDRWNGGSAIAMTSGSTGRPKCVVQAEEGLAYAAQSTIDIVGLEPGDAIGAFVPLSSMAAFCFGMYLPAHLGGTMVSIGRWRPDEALAVARQEWLRWTMLVPTMALQFMQSDQPEGALASLRAMTVGGGPMDQNALGQAEELLGTKILRVFGMSEVLGHTSPSPDEDREVRLGRDGRPFPGTEVAAFDELGHRLRAGEIGQGFVRGPSMCLGYARDGRLHPPKLTQDGFLPTGDLVVVNEDGTINVRGRQKSVIIRGGRNIDINEVEAAIAAMPSVYQVCVVPVPDALLGERVAALVVSERSDLDLENVTAFLDRSGFPKQKWPEFVITVDDLPQNRVGKLSRKDAMEIATEYAGGILQSNA
jgi:non-ribosomal peptide synthetase component E (peptide arylation enzyme)